MQCHDAVRMLQIYYGGERVTEHSINFLPVRERQSGPGFFLSLVNELIHVVRSRNGRQAL